MIKILPFAYNRSWYHIGLPSESETKYISFSDFLWSQNN